MRLPKISVVTPSFNQAQFLERTIRSVFSQEYPSLEYMVLDGGSSDGSVEIIRRYSEQLACWTSEPDKGQSDAIVRGWQRATGDILAWLNSDDFYCPSTLAIVSEYFVSHPHVKVLWGAIGLQDEGGKLLRVKNPAPLTAADLLLYKDVPGQAASFIRREVFEHVGGPRLDLHYVMDWEFWLRIALNYPPSSIACIDTVFAVITEWSGAKTITAATRDFQEVRSVLTEVFSSGRLPPELQRLRNRAFARTWWRQSKSELDLGQNSPAFQSLLKALRLAPTAFQFGKVLRQLKRIAFQHKPAGLRLKREKLDSN